MQPNAYNVTTLLLLAVTIFIIQLRWRSKMDINWPLFYYVALVAYIKKFEDVIDPIWVYTAVVLALLLRFEYLAGWALKLVQVLETACLIYVVLRCTNLVFGIP